MKATYTKLKTGGWGIRIEGKPPEGTTVTVTKKSGAVQNETVGKILWTDGEITLAEIGGKPTTARKNDGRSALERKYMNQYGWDGVRGSPSYYSSGMYDEES